MDKGQQILHSGVFLKRSNLTKQYIWKPREYQLTDAGELVYKNRVGIKDERNIEDAILRFVEVGVASQGVVKSVRALEIRTGKCRALTIAFDADDTVANASQLQTLKAILLARFGCREVSNMDPRTCEDPLSGDEEDDDREEHIVVDTSSNSQPVLKFEESAERDWSTLLAGTFLKRSNFTNKHIWKPRSFELCASGRLSYKNRLGIKDERSIKDAILHCVEVNIECNGSLKPVTAMEIRTGKRVLTIAFDADNAGSNFFQLDGLKALLTEKFGAVEVSTEGSCTEEYNSDYDECEEVFDAEVDSEDKLCTPRDDIHMWKLESLVMHKYGLVSAVIVTVVALIVGIILTK
mmetsp:Transcript_10938/g.16680  ORF Transcript_10938/g.16680 Transcript_10938/m.16680 type:complete len:350 (+) Transcript_10938:38-1087(+)